MGHHGDGACYRPLHDRYIRFDRFTTVKAVTFSSPVVPAGCSGPRWSPFIPIHPHSSPVVPSGPQRGPRRHAPRPPPPYLSCRRLGKEAEAPSAAFIISVRRSHQKGADLVGWRIKATFPTGPDHELRWHDGFVPLSRSIARRKLAQLQSSATASTSRSIQVTSGSSRLSMTSRCAFARPTSPM